MKRFFAMFVLTQREQRLVVLVVLAVLVWTWVQHQQEVKRETAMSVSSVAPNEP